MAITLPNNITHGNPSLSIVDSADVAGGLKQTGLFNNGGLSSSFFTQTDKFKIGTLLIVTSSNNLYYLTSIDPTLTTSWSSISSSLNEVTNKGNTTSNSIQVGGITVSGTASLNNVILASTLTDISGLTGPSGYVLSSTNGGVKWVLIATASMPSLDNVTTIGNVTSNGIQIGGLTVSGTASLNKLILNSTLTDISGLTGPLGYVLSATNGGVRWVISATTSTPSFNDVTSVGNSTLNTIQVGGITVSGTSSVNSLIINSTLTDISGLTGPSGYVLSSANGGVKWMLIATASIPSLDNVTTIGNVTLNSIQIGGLTVSGTSSLNSLILNSTLTDTTGLTGVSGYILSSINGGTRWIPNFIYATPSLNSITSVGNTTSNSIQIGGITISGTSSLNSLILNSTLTDLNGLTGPLGSILSSINGGVGWISNFIYATPSLDNITHVGNTTSNSIQIGGLTVSGTSSLNGLILNSTLTDFNGLTGPSGSVLSAINGGIRWIPNFVYATPSLNIITSVGNTTSNSIQIGGLTVSGTSSLNNLILNSTLTDISGLTGTSGFILSSTNGGTKWISNFIYATPSLDNVTTIGNTTSNSIQIGGLTVSGTASLNKLIVNSTLTDFNGLTGPSGSVLSAINGGIKWIPNFIYATPSLNNVTSIGNTTSNSIQIGGLTVSGTSSLNNLILASTLTDFNGLTGPSGSVLSAINGGIRWIPNFIYATPSFNIVTSVGNTTSNSIQVGGLNVINSITASNIQTNSLTVVNVATFSTIRTTNIVISSSASVGDKLYASSFLQTSTNSNVFNGRLIIGSASDDSVTELQIDRTFNISNNSNGKTFSMIFTSATDSVYGTISGTTSLFLANADYGKISWHNTLYNNSELASIQVVSDGLSQFTSTTSSFTPNTGNIVFNIGSSVSAATERVRITNTTMQLTNLTLRSTMFTNVAENNNGFPTSISVNYTTTRRGIYIYENPSSQRDEGYIFILALTTAANGYVMRNDAGSPTPLTPLTSFIGSVAPGRSGGAASGYYYTGGNQYGYFSRQTGINTSNGLNINTFTGRETIGFTNQLFLNQIQSVNATYSHIGFASNANGSILGNAGTSSIINIISADFRAGTYNFSGTYGTLSVSRYAMLIDYTSATIPLIGGTATQIYQNAWGIYQSENNTKNYFNGNILLGTTNSNGSLLQVNGTSSTNNLLVSSTLQAYHIYGTGSTSSLQAIGTGAGTVGTPTFSITGTDIGGNFTITTSVTAVINQLIVSIKFNSSYAVPPSYIALSAGNSNAASVIQNVYVRQENTTTTFFEVWNQGTALLPNTTYVFYYSSIQ